MRSAAVRGLAVWSTPHPDLDGPDRPRMGSMMAKSCRGHRPLNLEIGFEAGRGSCDVLGRAYERLLPLLARSPSPSAQATRAKGERYDNPAFESGFSSSRAADGHLRSGLV